MKVLKIKLSLYNFSDDAKLSYLQSVVAQSNSCAFCKNKNQIYLETLKSILALRTERYSLRCSHTFFFKRFKLWSWETHCSWFKSGEKMQCEVLSTNFQLGSCRAFSSWQNVCPDNSTNLSTDTLPYTTTVVITGQ